MDALNWPPLGKTVRWAMLAGSCALAAGCGTQYYEERLAETRKLYEYYQKLDAQLSQPATVGGVAIRVPKQFQPIPAPPPPKKAKDEDGQSAETEDEPQDPRQPEWFPEGVTLPGLAGAWKAELSTPGGKTLPAWIYVLSKYSLSREEKDLAPTFDGAIQQRIIAGLQQPTTKPLSWLKLYAPQEGVESFADRMFYWAATPPSFTIDGETYLMSVYMFGPRGSGRSEAAIVYVRPQDAESGNLKDQIGSMLETVNMTGGRLGTGGGAGRGGGAAF